MTSTSSLSERPPAPTLQPGMMLDRYELVAKLADGGMASVWVARQHGKHQFEKFVAVKTILPKFVDNDPFRRMFLDEARIAARISQTNVARILDLGEEGPFLYLAMEWVEGEVLAALLRAVAQRKEPFPPNVFLRIVADACAGLHAAHELTDDDGSLLGVVHRDVSPQNIIVSTEGHAKVIDFGIARANNRLTEETSFGTIKGKVQYMAPEQARGGEITRTADVYSMGAMLYHFFAKRFVHAGATEVEIMTKLVTGAPVDALPEDVPEPIRNVTMKAVAFKPADRWATMVDMREALEEAMRATDLRATTADVAAYVKEISGARVTARRERVRAAIQAIDDRQPVPEGSLVPSSPALPVVSASLDEANATSSVRSARPARAKTDAPTSPEIAAPVPAPEAATRRRRTPLLALLATAAVVTAGAFATKGSWYRPAGPAVAASTAAPEPSTAHANASAANAKASTPTALVEATAPPAPASTTAAPAKTGTPAPAIAAQGNAPTTPTNAVTTAGLPSAPPSAPSQPSATTSTRPEAIAATTTAPASTPTATATVTAAAAPTVAAPATTTAAPAVAPKPPFDATHARAVVAGFQNERGVRKRDLQVALARAVPGMTQCYQAELARLGRAEGGQGTVRIETDVSGRIVKATAAVRFSSAVARCVERAVIGLPVANVDTGEAEANVLVSFEP